VFDQEGPDRGPPTSLRGWLSDIYIPVLLDSDEQSLAALISRLGGRATVDDPIFGRASGLPALERYAKEMSAWFKTHKASYERQYFTTGVDRDVTEGVLTLTFDAKTVELPIAVVAERRRSREIELRLYYSTQPFKGTYALRSPLVPEDAALVLPTGIDEHIEALSKGDVDALLAGFEADGSMREARGLEHAKAAGLREFYVKLFSGASGAPAANAERGVQLLKGGAADDGRTCALEYTLVKIAGRNVTPQAALAVYERGDSGLLRSLRVYDDLES
jgi:hypothetical protein